MHHVAVHRYVALLQGINVGGRHKVGMEDLRELLGSLGHAEVETYLQSGNALFTSTREDMTGLGLEIQEQLRSRLGTDVKVLVRTPAELAGIVASNPFPAAVAEPSKLHVAFLSAMPDADNLAKIDPSQFEPDELRVGGQAVYLWYPNGAGRSRLTNAVLERRLGVTATTRNWNTVMKLLERSRLPPLAASTAVTRRLT